MLNSGYQIDIKEGDEANIYIDNSISEKELTVFQKNIISCAKNSKVLIIEEHVIDKQSNNN